MNKKIQLKFGKHNISYLLKENYLIPIGNFSGNHRIKIKPTSSMDNILFETIFGKKNILSLIKGNIFSTPFFEEEIIGGEEEEGEEEEEKQKEEKKEIEEILQFEDNVFGKDELGVSESEAEINDRMEEFEEEKKEMEEEQNLKVKLGKEEKEEEEEKKEMLFTEESILGKDMVRLLLSKLSEKDMRTILAVKKGIGREMFEIIIESIPFSYRDIDNILNRYKMYGTNEQNLKFYGFIFTESDFISDEKWRLKRPLRHQIKYANIIRPNFYGHENVNTISKSIEILVYNVKHPKREFSIIPDILYFNKKQYPNLKELILGDIMNNPLDLSYSEKLISFTMGHSFNHEVILSPNLKYLKMGFNFNKKITLNENLLYLEMGYRFKNGIGFNSLALGNKLHTLKMGKDFNQDIIKLPESLHIFEMGWDFDKPIYLPSNLKELRMGFSFNQDLDDIPSSLNVLEMGENFNQKISLKEGLKKLIMNHNFNEQIDYIPYSLEVLVLGNSYNYEIKYFPDNLRHLKIGSHYKHPIRSLPKSLIRLDVFGDVDELELTNDLKILTLSGSFNRPIKLPETLQKFITTGKFNQDIVLPKFLSYLYIGPYYEKEVKFNENLNTLIFVSVHKNTTIYKFPDSLKSLDLPYFNNEFIMPKNLIELKLGHNYPYKISNFPDSLTSLTINSDNVNNSIWPKNLVELKLIGTPKEKIMNLPKSLLNITIDSGVKTPIEISNFIKIFKIDNSQDKLSLVVNTENKIEFLISKFNVLMKYPDIIEKLIIHSESIHHLDISKNIKFLEIEGLDNRSEYNIDNDNIESLTLISEKTFNEMPRIYFNPKLLSLRIKSDLDLERTSLIYENLDQI